MANRILLVGNPNVGKSSLFNLLTGIRQKTGNYDGVTVEKKEGHYQQGTYITDLPGILLKQGFDVRALPVLKPIEALSVNTVEQLAQVEAEMQKSHS